MTATPFGPGPTSRQRRNAICVAAAGLVACTAIVAAGVKAGYRINMTPSEPLGLWRIRPLERPVVVGDLVLICPPAAHLFIEARARGYLRRGLCPSGAAPLIKTVVAIAGQRVEIVEDIRIDGQRIPNSRVSRTDGKGRKLRTASGGVVPDGKVFLHSPYSASWDSRYFGPIPASGILGLAQEMLTYVP